MGRGEEAANSRVAVQVQVALTWTLSNVEGEDRTGLMAPRGQHPEEGEGTLVVSDTEGSEEGDRRFGICAICLDRSATRAMYDCGHIATCGKCTRALFRVARLAGRLVKCPCCRATVRDATRLFTNE